MAIHNDFGKKAEDAAAKYLQQQGYKILCRNYRWQKAEIDIIAIAENTLVIVEVKARADNRVIEPHEAVNRKKIKLLVSAADHFLEEFQAISARFDIITLLKDREKFSINHIINAFESIDAQ